jgi:hypothetical protein
MLAVALFPAPATSPLPHLGPNCQPGERYEKRAEEDQNGQVAPPVLRAGDNRELAEREVQTHE